MEQHLTLNRAIGIPPPGVVDDLRLSAPYRRSSVCA